MKPFNLEDAKAGKAVCTRDGRDVRILCFDRVEHTGSYSLVGLFKDGGKHETVQVWMEDGTQPVKSLTLFMKSVKHERWGVRVDGEMKPFMFESEKGAATFGYGADGIIVHITWEE